MCAMHTSRLAAKSCVIYSGQDPASARKAARCRARTVVMARQRVHGSRIHRTGSARPPLGLRRGEPRVSTPPAQSATTWDADPPRADRGRSRTLEFSGPRTRGGGRRNGAGAVDLGLQPSEICEFESGRPPSMTTGVRCAPSSRSQAERTKHQIRPAYRPVASSGLIWIETLRRVCSSRRSQGTRVRNLQRRERF